MRVPVRLLLLGCRPLLHDALARLFAETTGLCLAGDGSERSRDAVLARRPDVVLIDCQHEDPELLALGAWLQGRRRTVVYLAAERQTALCRRMLAHGATSCVTSACSGRELQAVLEAAARGRRYLPAALARRLADPGPEPAAHCSPFDQLSGREWQVTLLILAGHRAGRISQMLALSPKTISTYRSRIFDKLCVHGDAAVVRLAYDHGVLASLAPTARRPQRAPMEHAAFLDPGRTVAT